MKTLNILTALQKDTRGATAVEYGLILALVILVMLAALTNVASLTINMWNGVSSKVTSAVSNSNN